MTSGETLQVTRLDRAPRNLAWSPDGKWLAFALLVPSKPPTMGTLPAKPEGANWATPPRSRAAGRVPGGRGRAPAARLHPPVRGFRRGRRAQAAHLGRLQPRRFDCLVARQHEPVFQRQPQRRRRTQPVQFRDLPGWPGRGRRRGRDRPRGSRQLRSRLARREDAGVDRLRRPGAQLPGHAPVRHEQRRQRTAATAAGLRPRRVAAALVRRRQWALFRLRGPGTDAAGLRGPARQGSRDVTGEPGRPGAYPALHRARSFPSAATIPTRLRAATRFRRRISRSAAAPGRPAGLPG